MFLNKLISRNRNLIDYAIKAHNNLEIAPDTYIIDLDTFVDNAKKILEKANLEGIELFFMLKQIGRNPLLAKKLIELGYPGAVCVDFKEALRMMQHNIAIMNVGNLVQVPKIYLEDILKYGVKYLTVYSLEKLRDIDEISAKLGKVQKIMLRIQEKDSIKFDPQSGGFQLDELDRVASEFKKLKNVELSALTAFPAFSFDENYSVNDNYNSIIKAREILQKYGYNSLKLDLPSGNALSMISYAKEVGADILEPGHSFTGTCPYHVKNDDSENICILYLSEVSHTYDGNSYIYGGGHYRRGHVKNVLIDNRVQEVKESNPTDIDYYFKVIGENKVNQTAIMAFRFQIFVTRSDVCIVSGLSKKNPKIEGFYDSLGREKCLRE